MVLAAPSHAGQYERRRPERTALYEVMRDNLGTVYGAIDDGALDIKLAKHAKELEAAAQRTLQTSFGSLRQIFLSR